MFRKTAPGWLGFDLGNATVKAAQVVRMGGAYRVHCGAVVPRRETWKPDELTAEATLTTADEMQTAASLCHAATHGKPAAAVVPMTLCDVVQVGADSANRGGDSLRAQVEAELHQSVEGYVLGTWPAHLQADKANVITLPEPWSDQVSRDVTAGRHVCRAIEPLPLALARAVRLSDPETLARPVLAFDWGYGRATLCLVRDGAPALVRTLKDCGFERTIACAAAALRLTHSDAERVLRRHSLDPAAPSHTTAVADAIAEPVYVLQQELRRTLAYWQGQTRGVRAEAAYLFGGGASLDGIESALGTLLEMPAQRWTLAPAPGVEVSLLPPIHLLGPALAASALAWEGSWPQQ